MKKELYVCDNCKEPILTGYVLSGGLHAIQSREYKGGIAGGAEGGEYHYCYNCFLSVVKSYKFPDKTTVRELEEQEQKRSKPINGGWL